MTPATEVRVVPATEEHIPFVAWVVNTANRSHLPEGLWDKFIGKGEAEVLRYLEVLVQTEQKHTGSYDLFLIAEVDGVPAAGLCGFFENEVPGATMMAAAMEANGKAGLTREEVAAGWDRAKAIMGIPALTHEPLLGAGARWLQARFPTPRPG